MPPTDEQLQQIADGGTPETVVTTTGTPNTETRVPVSLKDDDLVELTIDGQKVTKSYKDARDGWQRQEDYTRGKQSVAQRLTEIKEIFDGLTAKQKELALKEQGIDQILGRGNRTPQNAAPADDEVVPFGQVKNLIKESVEAERKAFNDTLAEHARSTAEAATFTRWEEKVTEKVDALQSEFPSLQLIPNLVGALKRMAKEDQPQNEQELLASIVKHGKAQAAKLDSFYEERAKADAVKRKQLREKGPEPAKGQASFKAPEKSYVKNRKIDWDGIEKDVMATLEAMED